MATILFVRAEWDEEAHVWVATSNDVPGLVTEAQSFEELDNKLKVMIPELLEANGLDYRDIPFELLARKIQVTGCASC